MLTVNYRFPNSEHITISYNSLTASVTYHKFAEIMKDVARIEDIKSYVKARERVLIEYLENNNQINIYKW